MKEKDLDGVFPELARKRKADERMEVFIQIIVVFFVSAFVVINLLGVGLFFYVLFSLVFNKCAVLVCP